MTPNEPHTLWLDTRDRILPDGVPLWAFRQTESLRLPHAWGCADRSGCELAHAGVPALGAPVDITPKTARVALSPPAKADWSGGRVTIEPGGTLPEITRRNNEVRF